MMRRTFTVAALCLSLCAGGFVAAQAQPHGEAPRDSFPQGKPAFAEVPNPEKAARRKTDRLKEQLQLTDKQYEKVYKLNLKEQEEMMEDRMPGGPRMGGRPMGGPGGGQPPTGGPGGGMPPMGFGGGQPPQMGNAPADLEELRRERAEEMKKKAEKRAKNRDKKMKKILTDEQYAKWKALPPERPKAF